MLKGISLRIVSLALLLACLLAAGAESRWEIARAAAGPRQSIPQAERVVRACAPGLDRTTRQALVTYLSIEDHFRPRLVRDFEYAVAAAGAWLDLRPVETIGIGQISFATFRATREHSFPGEAGVTPRQWISALRDDCRNISVLLDALAVGGHRCAVREPLCALSFVCFWHAGDERKCVRDPKFTSYLRAAAALLLEADAAD